MRSSIRSIIQPKFGRVTLSRSFESGLAKAYDPPFLGHRADPTTGPTFALSPEYTWHTYVDVDTRRCAIGTAFESYFKSGKPWNGTDFGAIGVWTVIDQNGGSPTLRATGATQGDWSSTGSNNVGPDRTYMGAMASAHRQAPETKGYLFRRAIATKLANLHATGATGRASGTR